MANYWGDSDGFVNDNVTFTPSPERPRKTNFQTNQRRLDLFADSVDDAGFGNSGFENGFKSNNGFGNGFDHGNDDDTFLDHRQWKWSPPTELNGTSVAEFEEYVSKALESEANHFLRCVACEKRWKLVDAVIARAHAERIHPKDIKIMEFIIDTAKTCAGVYAMPNGDAFTINNNNIGTIGTVGTAGTAGTTEILPNGIKIKTI